MRRRASRCLVGLGSALLTVCAAGPAALTCDLGAVRAAAAERNPLQLESWPPPAQPTAGDACSSPLAGAHATYDVGPGHRYPDLNSVPWLGLQAGDVVNIYYRPEPYRSKLGLRAQGTLAQPVVLNGVTDAACRRPEISGADAGTPADLARARFFSKQYSEFLGTIFIYRGPGDPYGWRPAHIAIRNLKIGGAHQGLHYTAQDGTQGEYGRGAAGIFAILVDHLLIENCEVSGNGNGIFVNSRSDEEWSSHVTVRRSLVHDNGNVGSYYEHNLYLQGARTLVEGNYIGQLIPGAIGSSLKDRSSGTVIRYNRIDAAARAIDLVEIEGGVLPVFTDPLYRHAWVYGNLIVSDFDRPAAASSLLVHWGGDNDPRYFRNGTLHFYFNTVATRASSEQAYFQNIFDMPDDGQTVVAGSNVFVHQGSSIQSLVYRSGHLVLQDTNWISRGWTAVAHDGGTVERGGTLLEGRDPGLDAAWVPGAESPLIGQGVPTPAAANAPAIVSRLQADLQYAPVAAMAPRQRAGVASDLGAFERRSP